MAIESTLVTADVVEATAFPQLVQRYRVSGVPKTIVDERVHIEGAVPERQFVEQVVKGAPRTSSA